jgi:hypothetical protein
VIIPNTLTDGVPKVTEAHPYPFWHFCHPAGLGILKIHLRKRKQRLWQSLTLVWSLYLDS